MNGHMKIKFGPSTVLALHVKQTPHALDRDMVHTRFHLMGLGMMNMEEDGMMLEHAAQPTMTQQSVVEIIQDQPLT